MSSHLIWTIIVVFVILVLIISGIIIYYFKDIVRISRSRQSSNHIRSAGISTVSSRPTVHHNQTSSFQETNHPTIFRQNAHPCSQTLIPQVSSSQPPPSDCNYNTNFSRNQGGSSNTGTLPVLNTKTRRSSYSRKKRHRHSFTAPYPTSSSLPVPGSTRVAPYPIQPSHPLPQTSTPLVVPPYPVQPLHPLPHTAFQILPSEGARYPVNIPQRHSFEFRPSAPVHHESFFETNRSGVCSMPTGMYSNNLASGFSRPPSYAEVMATEPSNRNKRPPLQKSTSLYDNN